MAYKWGNRSKERMTGVNPILIECATRALAICREDMTIPWMGGLRTAEEQNEIFKDGNSKLDGFNKKSYHQTGNAIDVIPVKGSYSNSKGFREFARSMFHTWQVMIKEGKVPDSIYLEWGGNWRNFIDVPHWQIVKR